MAWEGRATEEIITALHVAEVRLGQAQTASQVSNIDPDVVGTLWQLERFETAQGEV